jgi:hypothetical protein
VELLVNFDSLSIDGEAIEMARARGSRVLGREELPYRRAALANLKQSAQALR